MKKNLTIKIYVFILLSLLLIGCASMGKPGYFRIDYQSESSALAKRIEKINVQEIGFVMNNTFYSYRIGYPEGRVFCAYITLGLSETYWVTPYRQKNPDIVKQNNGILKYEFQKICAKYFKTNNITEYSKPPKKETAVDLLFVFDNEIFLNRPIMVDAFNLSLVNYVRMPIYSVKVKIYNSKRKRIGALKFEYTPDFYTLDITGSKTPFSPIYGYDSVEESTKKIFEYIMTCLFNSSSNIGEDNGGEENE